MVELNESELERVVKQVYLDTLATDVVYNLDELVANHGTGLTFEVEVDYYYGDCSVSIYLRQERLETDAEYEERIEKLKARKAKLAIAAEKRRKSVALQKKAKEAEERELYEKLRKKFEKG